MTGIASNTDNKLNVFISYSRDDLEFADQLEAGLGLAGFGTTLDRHGISGGEDWKRRLGNLIRDADTVGFVLSPSSAVSEICAWEVEEAVRLGKRIIPVVCRALQGTRPPPQLAELNYIFFYREAKSPGSGFGTGLAQLAVALNTDLDWLREHTRLLRRATEWDSGARPVNRLLSGADIEAAKAWAARRPKAAPEPTALHLDFVRASEEEEGRRLSAEEQRLKQMAEAQAAREAALADKEAAQKREAEAQRREIEAQRRRSRIQAVAIAAVSMLAVLAGWQWWRAEEQRSVADGRRRSVEAILEAATKIIIKLENQFDDETKIESFLVFKNGAEQGNTVAMFNLGFNYHAGLGVKQDYVKAKEWYERAAAEGFAKAMDKLGTLYENGQGVEQDYAKAFAWFQKAANAGHAEAMEKVGNYYLHAAFGKLGFAPDAGKSLDWYQKAAAVGNAGAMRRIGELYWQGLGVPLDNALAREWFEKAAAAGDPAAMSRLGAVYAHGLGAAQDYAKSREWYEKAAAKGESIAMLEIGDIYARGLGIPQDDTKAREWYEKAVVKGYYTSAMLKLGELYETGRGVPQDHAKAWDWYAKAVVLGDDQARQLFEKVAATGDAVAMIKVGDLYANGRVVKQDDAKAREWYGKAATTGDVTAMNKLGDLYTNGQGGAQDYAKAREWYEKAAAKSDQLAAMKLEQLPIVQAMTARRYADALRLAEMLALKLEEAETQQGGKPGSGTAEALVGVSWCGLFVRDYSKALSAAERASALLPKDLSGELNRAHALMFLGRRDDAMALYRAYRGKSVSDRDTRLWERVVAEDFSELRDAGATHQMMAEVEKELGIGR